MYVGSRDGKIYVIDVTTRQERYPPLDLKSGPLTSPTVGAGVIYFGTAAGSIFALDI
jgi:outer membrane protein assembly factor BamB